MKKKARDRRIFYRKLDRSITEAIVNSLTLEDFANGKPVTNIKTWLQSLSLQALSK